MAHTEQKDFCLKVKNLLPNYFKNNVVLDVGSLDINGNNRFLFESCYYIGIDIGNGPNVDIVCKAHEFPASDEYFNVIISTECFEHDMYYQKSLINIVRMLSKKGLFLFTCATEGRPEHGTRKTNPVDAPLLVGDWADYYKNLTEKDIREVLDLDTIFSEYHFEVNESSKDLYFYGIKK